MYDIESFLQKVDYEYESRQCLTWILEGNWVAVVRSDVWKVRRKTGYVTNWQFVILPNNSARLWNDWRSELAGGLCPKVTSTNRSVLKLEESVKLLGVLWNMGSPSELLLVNNFCKYHWAYIIHYGLIILTLLQTDGCWRLLFCQKYVSETRELDRPKLPFIFNAYVTYPNHLQQWADGSVSHEFFGSYITQ